MAASGGTEEGESSLQELLSSICRRTHINQQWSLTCSSGKQHHKMNWNIKSAFKKGVRNPKQAFFKDDKTLGLVWHLAWVPRHIFPAGGGRHREVAEREKQGSKGHWHGRGGPNSEPSPPDTGYMQLPSGCLYKCPVEFSPGKHLLWEMFEKLHSSLSLFSFYSPC